jgi:hypothetical protein
LEYNINPASTAEEFLAFNRSVLSQLQDMVPGYELAVVPTAEFDKEHMAAQPPKALELGCEPDYNAYTGDQNPRPNGNVDFRTAAGHVHIGFCEGADVRSPEHMQRCITLVTHLDAFLGLPSLCWDKDVKRRQLYGKAGAFRPKSYGVEYRTLSNAWLLDDKLIKYVFNQVQACVDYLKSGKRLKADVAQEYINEEYGYGRAYIKRILLDPYEITPPPEVKGV